MNITIPLTVNPDSQMGKNLYYLQNIRQQWQNLGPNVSDEDFMALSNTMLGNMVTFILNNQINEAEIYYNNNIDNVKNKRIIAFENWEISIRDCYLDDGKFIIPE